MTSLLAAALLAGLLGSPHCIGMCGGFAAACSRPRGGLPFWHAGRLTTYAALGALAGALGSALPGPAWVPAAISLPLLVWFAASLAGLAPGAAIRVPALVRVGARLAGRRGPSSRYLFGLATGLLPCGLVYTALAMPVAAASAAGGALAMLAFGAGTIPALTLLSAGVRRFAARGVWQRRLLAGLVLLAGLWSIGMRLAMGGRM